MHKEIRTCKIHGDVEHSIYSTKERGKIKTRKRCLLCYSNTLTNFRVRRKQEYVDYMGGGCVVCGYNNSLEALDFHHLDPLVKDFSISDTYRALDKMKTELDKCVLLCANHHREIHAGILDLKLFLPTLKAKEQAVNL